MKLLQLNMWAGRLEPQISALVKQEAPDILCLQEAMNIHGRTAGFFVSLEQLQELSGHEYLFSSPVLSFNFMRRTASYGNAVLSRYPLDQQETVFTNLQHVDNYDEDGDYNIRNLQHAVADINGTTVHLLNHHGHHVAGHKNGNADTLRQCQMIADYIDKLEGPIILAGDFNLAPHSESLELLNSRLKNLSIEYKLLTTRTNLTHKTEVCDYIFVSDGVTVNDFHALDEIVSDHKALLLDFEI